MTCAHYWREGILLFEHGKPDPHRDTCVVCRHEHKACQDVVHALPLVGARSAGDPNWEARVWSRIARLDVRHPGRRWLGAGSSAAIIAVMMYLAISDRGRFHETRPRIEVIPSETAMRSASPRVGDRVRIAVKPTDEVRIYRAAQLVLRCVAGSNADGCVPDAHGMVAEAQITAPGEYQLVVITSATAEPFGRLDHDLEAIDVAGGLYQITELSFR